MEKLYYKGKEISSEDAHDLDVEEKAFLTSRKPSLEESKIKKEVKKGEKKDDRTN